MPSKHLLWCAGGQINNDDSAEDVKTVDLTKVPLGPGLCTTNVLHCNKLTHCIAPGSIGYCSPAQVECSHRLLRVSPLRCTT